MLECRLPVTDKTHSKEEMERYDGAGGEEKHDGAGARGRMKPPPKPPKTPRTPRQRFNFSPASSRDNIVFGAERPGHVQPNRDQPSTPRGSLVSEPQVVEWIETLKVFVDLHRNGNFNSISNVDLPGQRSTAYNVPIT
jgi:hypothetical protein